MRLIRSLANLPEAARGSVCALGNFDGLHVGHIAVLEQAKQEAKRLNAPLSVMSFEPHPRRLFKPELPTFRILPLGEKLRQLRAFGVDTIFLMRFNREFSQITAETFTADLLCKQLAIKGLVTGDNFIFGHKRTGNVAYLTEAATQHGFSYHPVPAVMHEGEPCSSTRIRNALASGDMQLAAQLLGKPYTISTRVIKGDQRGRALGFPTANMRPGPLFQPAFGIYATRIMIEGYSTIYSGVANYGLRPMYALEQPLLETYLFDTKQDLYGKKLTVQLLHHLRSEQNFDSETALIQQMQQDEAQARTFLAQTTQQAG